MGAMLQPAYQSYHQSPAIAAAVMSARDGEERELVHTSIEGCHVHHPHRIVLLFYYFGKCMWGWGGTTIARIVT